MPSCKLKAGQGKVQCRDAVHETIVKCHLGGHGCHDGLCVDKSGVACKSTTGSALQCNLV